MSKAWPVRGLDPSAPLDVNARKILRVRIGEFYSYETIIHDIAAVDGLHNLRIAAKRLRYTLELFRSILGEQGERNIDRVKSIQEVLGQIHDADVRIALIEQELRELADERISALSLAVRQAAPGTHLDVMQASLRPPSDDPEVGLLALLGRAAAARTRHYHTFRALWEQYAREGMREDLVALSIVDTELEKAQ